MISTPSSAWMNPVRGSASGLCRVAIRGVCVAMVIVANRTAHTQAAATDNLQTRSITTSDAIHAASPPPLGNAPH
jgi:hypothetical protein